MTDTPEKMELEKAHKEKDKRVEQEKKKNEREKKRAMKAANQNETKKKTTVYSKVLSSTLLSQKRVTFRFHLVMPLIMRVQMSRVMKMMATRTYLLVTLSL
ncbi:unnamed protein product [Arctogadus glacialis]